MKPDEDMHAAIVEEVEQDPCELYTDLGTLIVEGRVPGPNTDRGFVEGPHCPHSSIAQNSNRHQCDPASPECQKYEQIQKHMLLLWKNGIPMTIEVLLYPTCCQQQTSYNNVESSVPDISYILLEQWTLHMLPRRVPDASISPRGLIQAVRSFLYFSQLCAWFSLTGGKSPRNVHYRVCVPGEAFSSKFSCQPETHVFPVANVSRNAAMKVQLKYRPRSGEIPAVPCHKHSTPPPPLKLSKGTQNGEDRQQSTGPQGEYVFDGLLPTALSSRTSSPADSMLGESLLDPPNSLCMYPRRYQSPSRCGSPSIEVPEHLMFGKVLPKPEECPPPRRSRPQRRPVVERFLKKNVGSDDAADVADNRTCDRQRSKDFLAMKADCSVLNCCCIEDYMKNFPQEEMEEVLRKLRERNVGRKGYSSCVCGPPSRKGDTSLLQFIDELKSSSNLLEQNKNLFYNKNSDYCDSKTLFKQALRLNKESSNKKTENQNLKSSTPPPLENIHHPKVPFGDDLHPLLANKLNLLHSSDHTRNNLPDTKPNPHRTSPTQYGSVNIKKCGDFLLKNDTGELSGDERDISDSVFEDELSSYPIPSAEKKALFRRSLDSATSLVFHQRSGLPLTSSPAPMRKSGTCFDFDSSLTTVSAIKRALFEKDEEEEEESEKENAADLSNSTPPVSSSLLGTFEESVLNGRLEPVSTVEGFTAEIGASGSFCPRHITLPVSVFFYTLQDMDKVASPYMGHINLRDREYHIPKRGTVQVTLFNPHRTVVKMFVVRYDLSDMPVNCQTFLRQRTLYMPSDASGSEADAQKWLRYLIHLRFMSSKSGRIYLHTDIRVIIFRKSDLDCAATVHGQRPYELRSFTHGPLNPKFSSHNNKPQA